MNVFDKPKEAFLDIDNIQKNIKHVDTEIKMSESVVTMARLKGEFIKKSAYTTKNKFMTLSCGFYEELKTCYIIGDNVTNQDVVVYYYTHVDRYIVIRIDDKYGNVLFENNIFSEIIKSRILISMSISSILFYFILIIFILKQRKEV